MPKAATETTTKKAKAALAKKTKAPKEEKSKRPPSAYNQFMKDRLSAYKSEHAGMSHKDAFTAVAAMWKDAPENPKRGETAVSRPKKKASEDKENATSKPKVRAKSKKQQEEVMAQSDEESLDMDSDDA